MIARAVVRAWVLLALALGGAGAARAQNYDFSFSAAGMSAMGTFITTDQGNGNHLITSIRNGTYGGSAISLLTSGSFQNRYAINNNMLSFPATSTYFDTGGFAFTRAGGGTFNVNYDSGQYNEYIGQNSSFLVSNLTVTLAVPAPLPGGGLLSFLALGLAGLIHRHRAILARGRDALARVGTRPATRPA